MYNRSRGRPTLYGQKMVCADMYLTQEHYRQLDQESAARNISRSALVRLIINEWMTNGLQSRRP
jgi:hypothetical protein